MANEQLFTTSTYSGGYTGVIASIPLPGQTGAPIQYGSLSIDADVSMLSTSAIDAAKFKLSSQFLTFSPTGPSTVVGILSSTVYGTNNATSPTGWSAAIQQATSFVNLIVSSVGDDVVNSGSLVKWYYTQGNIYPIVPSGYQEFLASAMWIAPPGVSSITVYGFGGGGGGGSGAGYDNLSPHASGGNGGATGSANTITVSVIPGTTYIITIGTGGVGGAGQGGNASGNAGSSGENTTFDVLATFYGGSGGSGGAINTYNGNGSSGSNQGSYTGGSGGTGYNDGANMFGGGSGGDAGPAGNGANGGNGNGGSVGTTTANSGTGGGGSGGGPSAIPGGNGGSGYLSITW